MKKNKEALYYFAVFGITLLGHVFFNFTFSHCSALPTEALSRAAISYFINSDWSSVLANSNYYGTGFYVIFTPLYMITDNAFVIRQVILFTLCVLLALQSVMGYVIITKYLEFDQNKWIAVFISFIVSYLPVIHSNTSINEPPLEFICWLVMFLSLVNMKTESKIKRIIYSVLIVALLIWSQSIHERAIVFITAYVICYVFMLLVFKKKILNIIAAVLTVAPVYIGYSTYTKWVKNDLWGSNSLTNTASFRMSTASSNLMDYLFSEDGLLAFAKTVLSQMFTANMYTCGLFMIAFISLIIFAIAVVTKRVKKEEISNAELSKLFIALLFGMATVATILFMGVNSLKTIILATETEVGSRIYSYLRYFFIFVPPLIMLSMVDLYRKEISSKLIYTALLSSVLLSQFVFYCAFKVPMEKNPGLQLDRFHYFSAFSLRKTNEPLTEAHFIIAVSVMFCCYAMIIGLYKSKVTRIIMLAIVFALLFYEYTYMNFNFMKNTSDGYYATMDGFDTYIKGNEDVFDSIKAVYAPNTTCSYMLITEYIHLKVYNENANELGDGEVLLTSSFDNGSSDIFYYVYLDENEYMYFSDENIYDILTQKGFKVKDNEMIDFFYYQY